MNYSQLVWFKKDLRVSDHSPLYQAAGKGNCLCLYIYEDEIINADDFDTRHFNFLNQSLIDLRNKLKELGSDLIIRRGECVEVLRKLHNEHPFETIWAHQETGNWISYHRDLKVLSWAKETGIKYNEFYHNGVVRKLHTRDGWSRIWNQRMNEKIIPTPSSIHSANNIDYGQILKPNDFNLDSTINTKGLLGGETQAKHCLDTFLSDRGKNYQKEMSSPVTAFDSCSRMSSYLTFGNISIKEVYQASKERANQIRKNKSNPHPHERGWLKSLSSFQSRLRWHCHFIQKLEDEPEIENENINISGIAISSRKREVHIDEKKVEDLTFTEFQILHLLASHPGWVFTRYQIIDKIRGDNYPVTDRSVDFQIVGLRKKMGKKGKLINTIRGVGYRFQLNET